jgi:3-hydroxyacyl-CoA dehydrogenase
VGSEVRGSVPDRVRANLRSLGWRRLAADQVIERMTVYETLEAAVEGAEVVVEAAPENLATKRRLLERLGELTGAGTSSATACSTPSGARRSTWSSRASATPRRSTWWSSPASGAGSACSARWRTPTWSVST